MGELESIRVFLAVAAQRSFSAAARELSMTPTAVTRAISALEDRVGAQLLLRTTRQVALTSIGAVYAARVAPLSTAFAAVSEEAHEMQGLISGPIRISAPMSLGIKVLPPILSQFKASYPRAEIALILSDGFVNVVEDDFDLVIRISSLPNDKTTVWRRICLVPRVLVASPRLLASRGVLNSPEELSMYSLLSYGAQGRVETWSLSLNGVTRTLKASKAFTANNGELLAQLAVQGEGIALLPRFIVEPDLVSGALVQVMPDWTPSEIWLTLHYPPYEHMPLRVATFSDFFERHVIDRPEVAIQATSEFTSR